MEVEDGVKFTPFNMKEELEEGHFDSEGTYIFSKDKVGKEGMQRRAKYTDSRTQALAMKTP